MMKSGTTSILSMEEQYGRTKLVPVRHGNLPRRPSQLTGQLAQRPARSTIVLLVLISTFTSISSSTWSYEDLTCYDDLRNASTGANDVIEEQTLLPEQSSVVEVTLRGGRAKCDTSPEATDDEVGGGDKGRTYRLCGLTSMTALSRDGVERADHVGSSVLALLHFNSKNGTVVPELDQKRQCDVRLTIEYFDTEANPIVASTHLVDEVLSRNHSLETPVPCSLVGASLSSVSDNLSILSSANDIPSISFASTSSHLDNKGIYKLFGRTVPTDSGTAIAAVKYLRDVLNVTHCAVLHIMDEWGIAFNTAFTQAAIEHGGDPPMKVVSASYILDDDAESIKTAVEQLAASGYNYFFGIVLTAEFPQVLQAATELGVMGPGKSWLFGELVLSDEKREKLKVHGLTFISLDMEPNSRFEEAWATLESDVNLKQYILSKTPQNLASRNTSFDSKPNEWNYFTYDAVMSIGFAACEAEGRFFSGQTLFDAFTKTSFTGVSGDVSFDNHTGTRDVSRVLYKVTNVVREIEANDRGSTGTSFKFVKVAQMKYDEDENDNDSSMKWDVLEQTIYADGSSIPPPVLRVDCNLTSTGVLVTGLTLAGIILAMSLAGVVWTVVYRTSRVVRMSQPEFLVMVCIGTMLMACALILKSLQEPASKHVLDAACMAFPWLFSTGWVVSFSALLSKSLRIRKLFKSPSGGSAHLNARDFLLPFILCFSVNIVLLIAFTIAAPLRWERHEVVAFTSDGKPYIVSVAQCDAGDDRLRKTFWGLFLVLHVACISFAFYENFRARRILTEYNENYYITLSLASILETYVLVIPLFFGVGVWTSHSRFFVLWSIFITIVAGLILLPLFVPKEVARRREAIEERKKTAQKSKLAREWDIWVHLTQKNDSLKKELASLKSTGTLDESHIYYPTTMLLERSKSPLDASSESSSLWEGSQVQQQWSPGLDQLCL